MKTDSITGDDIEPWVLKPLLLALVVGVTLALCGCGKRDAGQAATRKAEQEKVSAEERRFIEAARPFAQAVAMRNYEQAYGLLSSYARQRMSVNQFAPSMDDKQFERNEANALTNVKVAEFVNWMSKVEAEHGLPNGVKHIFVFSMDPAALSGRAEAVETMFAIGNMPKSVPVEIRRASVRCQIATRLSASQLEDAARAARVTVEKLQKDPDFQPYFNLKVVLVEEESALRVGYFEFLPPSMFD